MNNRFLTLSILVLCLFATACQGKKEQLPYCEEEEARKEAVQEAQVPASSEKAAS